MCSLLSVGSPAGAPADQLDSIAEERKLTISDSDNKQWLLELPLSSRTEEQGLQDLLVESGTERSETCMISLHPNGVPVMYKLTAELDLLDERKGRLLGIDVVALDLGVEESDLAI
jgi:hypothetical protein